jgi:hypothetical protein
VVGGGFRDSRLGELAIARAEIVLEAENFKIEMLPIHRRPDDAALSARYIWLLPRFSKLMTPSLPSTLVELTSAAASWKRLARRRRTSPRQRVGVRALAD